MLILDNYVFNQRPIANIEKENQHIFISKILELQAILKIFCTAKDSNPNSYY